MKKALLLFCTLVLASSLFGEAQRVKRVVVELVAREASIQPGEPFMAGLRIEHDTHWHTYWKTTTTGYSPSLDWDLPEGWEAGDILWPTPEVYEAGGIVDFINEGEVVLPVMITPSADLEPGQNITLTAEAKWLMCADVCIPGEADLRLTLPVRTDSPEPNPETAELFQTWENERPRDLEDWTVSAKQTETGIKVRVSPANRELRDLGTLYFFSDNSLIEATKTQDWQRENGSYTATLSIGEYAPSNPEALTGVLRAENGWREDGSVRGLKVDAAFGEQAGAVGGTTAMANGPATGFLAVLGLAFLGGLILNLMPCVFPVLGIKIMGFVNHAGEDRRRVTLHGVVFTLGVLLSFWALVAVLLALRAAGESLGWGFQLQNPTFVYFVAAVILLFALNMSGVFEIGQGLVGTGSQLQGKHGYTGSFFSGVLATIVATPCSAPFLGTALGAAFAMPVLEIFVVFTVIALGLATPYLLLSIFPQLVKKLPRPGAWMETFKQFMAFLLYGTVAYLVWVLAGQLGNEQLYGTYGFLSTLLALVALALAAWVYGRWTAPVRRANVRRAGMVAALVLAVAGLVYGLPDLDEQALARQMEAAGDASQGSAQPAVVEGSSKVYWEKWAPGKAEALAEAGHFVYVDFTARWCATCQTNKATVFSSSEVIDLFREKKVIALKADWTNPDPRIAEALEAYGKVAIPFNLVYRPGEEPVELPALLSPGIVIEALQEG